MDISVILITYNNYTLKSGCIETVLLAIQNQICKSFEIIIVDNSSSEADTTKLIHSDKRPDLFIPKKKKYNENELKSIIKNEEKAIFIATDEKNGNILGYAFCIFQKQNADSMQHIKTLYIDDLCVDENLRGGGIGYKIFEYVKNYAKEKHCYNLTLNVWALNESAKKFYEKCGLKIQKYTMENIL